MSSTRPRSAARSVPRGSRARRPCRSMKIERRDEDRRRRSRARRCAGPGRLWTRGRSSLSSSAADRGAQGARRSASARGRCATATRNPQSAVASSHERAQGVREGHVRCYSRAGSTDPRCRTVETLVTELHRRHTESHAPRLLRRAPRHARGARSESSASATPGCRSRWHSPRPGSTVTGIDLDEERVSAVNDGRSYLVDVPVERYDGVDGRLQRDDRLRARSPSSTRSRSASRRRSRRRARRTSPTSSRPPSPLQRTCARASSSSCSRRRTRGRPRRSSCRSSRRAGGSVGADFFLGYAPERVDPGNEQLHDPQHAEAGRGRDRRVPAAHRAALRARSSTRSCRSRARGSPRRPSSTRTLSAPSTSRWPTSWR